LDKDAGTPGSSAGTAMWPVMTMGRPAWTASWKGTRSLARNWSNVASWTGSPSWESTLTEPWPGKCLAAGSSPEASIPFEKATPRSAAVSALPDMDRAPIVGSAGPMVTSVAGAKSTLKPRAASSAAMASPASAASGSLPAAP